MNILYHLKYCNRICAFDTNCEEVRPRYYYNTVNDQNNLKPLQTKTLRMKCIHVSENVAV